MGKGKLIIFSAPSGAGKTMLVKHLLAQGLPLAFSVSATSRAPRSGETEGKDYYFLSPEAFKEKISKGALLEWEEVYPSQFYGTLKSEVDQIWADGKHVLFDIDVVGGVSIKKMYPHCALAIFVQPPSLAILAARLRGRSTDDEASIQKRLKKAQDELAYAPQFDYCLVNDNLSQAQDESLRVVQAFLAK